MVVILDVAVHDIRFPTSEGMHGSDAMHPDPDYSATYVVLKTDKPGLEGHGLTFTIGRGNEIVKAGVEALKVHLPSPPHPAHHHPTAVFPALCRSPPVSPSPLSVSVSI